MRTCLQKILVCVLICAMLLSLSACQDPENSSPLEMENEDYRLDKENGAWYLEFKDEESGRYENFATHFDSVADFYERLLYKGLPKQALAYAKNFFWRDDNGRIRLLDIENIYTIVLPCGCTEFSKYSVEWNGHRLGEHIDCEHASFIVMLPSEVRFDGKITAYESAYSACFDNNTRWHKQIVLSEEKIAERDATVYRWKFESDEDVDVYVDYVLTRGEKKVYVNEHYSEEAWLKESRKPSSVAVCIEEDGIRYYCMLSSLQERPSEDWLLSFGVKPFVPEEAAA